MRSAKFSRHANPHLSGEFLSPQDLGADTGNNRPLEPIEKETRRTVGGIGLPDPAGEV
jgi:hypothetical protein